MSDKAKAISITVVVTIVSFLLSQKLFPGSPDFPTPTSTELPFLIGLGVIESFAFGSALAYLFVYWKKAKAENIIPVHLSLVWLMGNWWVHDGLHRVNGHELTGLIKIEYGFHVTLIVAAFIVASYFLKRQVE